MEFFTTTGAASRRAGGCVVVGVYSRGKLGAAAADIDKASGGQLTKFFKQGDISAVLGKCRVLNDLPGVKAQRVAVVGLGKISDFGVNQYRQAIAAAVLAVKGSKTTDFIDYVSLENVAKSSAYYLARYAVETVGSALYTFTEMKSGKKPPASKIRRIGQAIEKRSDAAKAVRGAEHAFAIVEGMDLCKDLGNLPPNVCTPSYLARTAQRMARENAKLDCKVLNEADMKRLRMGSLLSVTRGAKEPAKLIVMTWKGAGRAKPVVLVGKGVTFDTGGISLKPGHAMDEMKYDMGGAAAVIGTMATIAALKLPINLTVVVPACENMPGSEATRPGDIVTSMSGQTIEILNTDAEGRLILCDALTYAKRFKPELMIDVATLTGACVIALGHHMTAIMSKNDDISSEIAAASVAAADRAWPLPLEPEYAKPLRSNFADFANVGSREGGAITAGCFLAKFTKGETWAHLDIAGVAWHSGVRKGSTGRPVPLLSQVLLARAGALP